MEKEIAAIEGELAKQGKRRGLPVLEDVRIAAPCPMKWEAMIGEDPRVRFCGTCSKNVYNLSAMPRAEAEALILEREGAMCVRVSKRADGTILSGDCPVGVRKRRIRIAAITAVSGSLMALGTAFGISRFLAASEPPVTHTAGEMIMQGEMSE